MPRARPLSSSSCAGFFVTDTDVYYHNAYEDPGWFHLSDVISMAFDSPNLKVRREGEWNG